MRVKEKQIYAEKIFRFMWLCRRPYGGSLVEKVMIKGFPESMKI